MKVLIKFKIILENFEIIFSAFFLKLITKKILINYRCSTCWTTSSTNDWPCLWAFYLLCIFFSFRIRQITRIFTFLTIWSFFWFVYFSTGGRGLYVLQLIQIYFQLEFSILKEILIIQIFHSSFRLLHISCEWFRWTSMETLLLLQPVLCHLHLLYYYLTNLRQVMLC